MYFESFRIKRQEYIFNSNIELTLIIHPLFQLIGASQHVYYLTDFSY